MLSVARRVLDRLPVLAQSLRGAYRFPPTDMLLYLKYGDQPGRSKHFPKIEEIRADGEFVELEIGEYRYWWPAGCDYRGLAWVHQEVFVPSTHNSYAYEYGGAAIRSGDWVLDAGACEGFFTRYALQRGAKVVTVEPVEELVEALGRTFAPEVQAGAVRIVPGALGEVSGEGRLEVRTAAVWESTTTSAGTELSEAGRPVRTYRFDDLLKQAAAPAPDFIKMDVEGAELSVILGARHLLREHKPRLAVAVYHGLDTARQVEEVVRNARPDYRIRCRGVYAWDRCIPRPAMLYAW